jgi:Protein of unknown function (DUF3300)
MTSWSRIRSTGTLHSWLVAIALCGGLPVPGAAQQEAAAAPANLGDIEEAALLSEDELDELVASVALYPDALLAQIFVASTYPLEVVKADRWVNENKEMPEEGRAEAADQQGWDPSVAVLATGFPDVINRMATELDQTELLGDAMLTQSDDVLAAVQRQRARADAMGNLPSNQAQTVTVEGDNIAIAPSNPEVVYVPTYDSQAVYTTPATAPVAPAVVTTTTGTSYPTGTVVVEEDDDDDYDTGALIATGLVSFGAGLLVSEVFDDDWGGYWGGGPSYGRGPIGWGGGGYVRPYPPGYGGGGVNGIGNDVNIDIDRDRTNVDRDGNWSPDRERQDRARDNIAGRRDGGTRRSERQAGADGGRTDLKRKLDAKGGGARSREELLGKRSGAPAAVNRADGAKRAKRQPAGSQSAFAGRKGDATAANRAADRGRQSKVKSGGGKRQAAARPQGGGGQNIARSGGSKPAAKRSSGGGRSAFNQRSGGGRQAQAAQSRGAKSRGGGGGRSGGGGRGGGGRRG